VGKDQGLTGGPEMTADGEKNRAIDKKALLEYIACCNSLDRFSLLPLFCLPVRQMRNKLESENY
jgi:hypothetical protein